MNRFEAFTAATDRLATEVDSGGWHKWSNGPVHGAVQAEVRDLYGKPWVAYRTAYLGPDGTVLTTGCWGPIEVFVSGAQLDALGPVVRRLAADWAAAMAVFA